MQALADGLEDGLHVKAQQGADAGGGGRAEVGHMVNLVLVQADGLHQVHLDFVAGGNPAQKVRAGGPGVLGHGEDRRDVVARVGVLGGEESVMVVQLAHGHAIGPGRPLGGNLFRDAKDVGATAAGGGRVCQGLGTSCHDGAAVQGGDGHRGVVDDAVDDHVRRLGVDGDGVGGNLGDLVGELVLVGQVFLALVDANCVVDGHDDPFAGGKRSCGSSLAAVPSRWRRL